MVEKRGRKSTEPRAPRACEQASRRDFGGPGRLERVRQALDETRARCDLASRLSVDPVSVVHRYADPLDQELVGLIASCVAFGNVKAFRAKLDQALARLGPRVAAMADQEPLVLTRLQGWKHRLYRGEELARLLIGARRVQRKSGSLGARFAGDVADSGTLRPALIAFTQAIREAGGLVHPQNVGAAHILADPSKASGCKRLLLYLRWMIRPADGIDLGLWTLPPRLLLIPVDVHIFRLARNLGFTSRKSPSWLAAEEITQVLRRFDPDDPAKYDFALCHLGMLQRCPSRRDAARCQGCGVQPVCRHWAGAPSPGEPAGVEGPGRG